MKKNSWQMTISGKGYRDNFGGVAMTTGKKVMWS